MSIPAAWHKDPLQRHELRYWDGQRWTKHVADAGVVSEDLLDRSAKADRDAPGPTGETAASESSPDDQGGAPEPPPPEPTESTGTTTTPTEQMAVGVATEAMNRPARVALVAGIVSLVAIVPVIGVFVGGPLGLAAVIAGVIGLLAAKKTEQGRGRSIAGIVLGAIALTVVAVQVFMAQRLMADLIELGPDELPGLIERLLSAALAAI